MAARAKLWLDTSEGSLDGRTFDTIVVGSGNGAMGFLMKYLEGEHEESILVVEEGMGFFEASDYVHQASWAKSFGQGDYFKLHKARTPDGRPIISGRACVMGGGGSINYSMVHEADEWLAEHVGRDAEYWRHIKEDLNGRFNRLDPKDKLTPIAQYIHDQVLECGFEDNEDITCGIRSYPDSPHARKLLTVFADQFNDFGQRMHSGVSLVNWHDPRLTLKTYRQVEDILIQGSEVADDGEDVHCTGLRMKNIRTAGMETVKLADGGKLIMCAGSQSPRMLMKHASRLKNPALGKHVLDHVLIPLGVYVTPRHYDATARDSYVPIFATVEYKDCAPKPKTSVVNFDFFAGNIEHLWYMLSLLGLSFFPNCLKTAVQESPFLLKSVRVLIQAVLGSASFLVDAVGGFPNFIQGKPWKSNYDVVVPIIKYSTQTEGEYVLGDGKDRPVIHLGFFCDNQDAAIGAQAIKEHIDLLNRLGQHPPWPIKALMQLLFKIPYAEEEVDDYVAKYGEGGLLSEQHLSGGCLFGEAVNKGEEISSLETGKVYGSENIYVADLSTVVLPRVSPQMTAYAIGFHVAKQLLSKDHTQQG